MVYYFNHHYGFVFISASCKCRPIEIYEHLCDASITRVASCWLRLLLVVFSLGLIIVLHSLSLILGYSNVDYTVENLYSSVSFAGKLLVLCVLDFWLVIYKVFDMIDFFDWLILNIILS